MITKCLVIEVLVTHPHTSQPIISLRRPGLCLLCLPACLPLSSPKPDSSYLCVCLCFFPACPLKSFRSFVHSFISHPSSTSTHIITIFIAHPATAYTSSIDTTVDSSQATPSSILQTRPSLYLYPTTLQNGSSH